MSYFFVKNLSKIVWTALVLVFLSWYNLWSSKHLFYALADCHTPKFGSASNIISFVLSVLSNSSKSSFNMKCFCWWHFLWAIFILFVTTTFPIYVKFTFTKFSSCLSRVCQMVALSAFSQSAFSSVIPFLFNSTLTFYHYHVSFLCYTFILKWPILANSLFQLSIFVKRHMGLSVADKEVKQLHTLLSALKLNKCLQGPVSDKLWKKWHNWSLIMMNICYFCSDLWTEELAVIYILCNYLH